jgi:hypothetical protein
MELLLIELRKYMLIEYTVKKSHNKWFKPFASLTGTG